MLERLDIDMSGGIDEDVFLCLHGRRYPNESLFHIFDGSSTTDISDWHRSKGTENTTKSRGMNKCLGHDRREDLLLGNMRDQNHRIDEGGMIGKDDHWILCIEDFEMLKLYTIAKCEDFSSEKQDE